MGLEDFIHKYGVVIVLITALLFTIGRQIHYKICLKCFHFSLREHVRTTVEYKDSNWVSADIRTIRCSRAGCHALRRHHIDRRPATKEEVAALG